MEETKYLHLEPGAALPPLERVAPFRTVLVIESETAPDWRWLVSDWLVRSGCRYTLVWGRDCDAWHTSVDETNLALFNYGEIPESEFVMTTGHEDEALRDTFWFSDACAVHPSLELKQTYIVHIAPKERGTDLLNTYREAQERSD